MELTEKKQNKFTNWLLAIGLGAICGLMFIGASMINNAKKVNAYDVDGSDVVFHFNDDDLTNIFNFVDENGVSDNDLNVYFCNPYLYDDEDNSFELENIVIGYDPQYISFTYDSDNDGYLSYVYDFDNSEWDFEDVTGSFVTPASSLVFNPSTTGYNSILSYFDIDISTDDDFSHVADLILNITGEDLGSSSAVPNRDFQILYNYLSVAYPYNGSSTTIYNNLDIVFYNGGNQSTIHSLSHSSSGLYIDIYTDNNFDGSIFFGDNWSIVQLGNPYEMTFNPSYTDSGFYYGLKQSVYDYHVNIGQDGMQNILTYIVGLLTGGIVGLSSGIGLGTSTLVSDIFISNGALSVFGGMIIVFASLSLAIGLCRWVMKFLTSLGAKK